MISMEIPKRALKSVLDFVFAGDRRLMTQAYFAANSAAADTCCTAVTSAEPSAAFMSFQWIQPSRPPTQNVNSADGSREPACHFGG
jgi:hypothetical protein